MTRREYNKKWREDNPEKYRQNIENWYINNPQKSLYIRKKSNAKTKGIEFSIEFEDIDFPTYCPIFNFELDYSYRKKHIQRNSPSFDRIDPNKGYIKGNVRIISQLANAMKQNASLEELKQFAEWVLKND